MKFHLYQLAIILISVYMLYQGTRNYIRGKSGYTIYKLLIRLFVWGGMIIVAVFPDTLGLLAEALGIIDSMNAVVITSFLFVFIILFKLLSAVEKLEQNISELTRKESLRDIDK
jgi:hypothetical protein